jgi:hypothetical protein
MNIRGFGVIVGDLILPMARVRCLAHCQPIYHPLLPLPVMHVFQVPVTLGLVQDNLAHNYAIIPMAQRSLRHVLDKVLLAEYPSVLMHHGSRRRIP